MTANLCKDYLKAGRVTQTASYDTLEDYLGAGVTVTGEDRLVYDFLMELEEAFISMIQTTDCLNLSDLVVCILVLRISIK